jgi:tRNA dimethylallyltransferase
VVKYMAMDSNWKELLTSHLSQAGLPLAVILGPTASGKTAFSLHIGEFLRTQGREAEIVNADSRQLYRFLDIGTAKIRREDMLGIPHYLIDVLDPKREVTAAWYQREANTSIGAILSRGNVPILVGGSMLYLSAVLDALGFIDPADPALRRRLEAAYDADGGKALYAKLQNRDPQTSRAFHRNNRPYVLRAMEILTGTGRPPSTLKRRGNSPWNPLLLGMQWPRSELAMRIEKRTRAMFHAGWVEEVCSLLERGYSVSDPGMKSHGYREIAHEVVIDKRNKGPGDIVVDALVNVIAAKSRRYSKRQMTWWRLDQRIRWLDGAAILDGLP